MTEQEKLLLLQDLCARLPYGIFVEENRISLDDGPVIYTVDYHPYIYDCKPYLRPLASMTEEEKEALWNALDKDMDIILDNIDAPIIHVYKNRCYRGNPTFNEIEFLNQQYFDWRGLIPLGLAIEAPKDMYHKNTKNYGSDNN